MKTINLSYPLSLPKEPLNDCVAAIGFFDGIHQGHRKVINRAVSMAKAKGLKSAVITFHPHPSTVLKQRAEQVTYITPLKEKKRLLNQLQIDYLYIIEFNRELSLLSPEQFLNTYIKSLNVNHLIAGFDFTFGHKGAGNMNNISQYSKGEFTFETIEKVELDEEKISSTKIRALLDNGHVEKVNELLGRKLSIEGRVIEGDRRGRTIGFPTANLLIDDDYYLPKIGVYAVEVNVKGEKHFGMVNVGVVPTFKEKANQLSVEVHILNFDQQIYGESLTLSWCHFIRNEKKFSSVDELVVQLKRDEEKVRQLFQLSP